MLKIGSRFPVKTSLLAPFRSNRGVPPFKSLEHLGTQCFKDTYFDKISNKRTGTLSKCGIWVRQRERTHSESSLHRQANSLDTDAGYQGVKAKKHIYGGHNHSLYAEYTNAREIRALVHDYLPNHPSEAENFGLELLASFTTTREHFMIDKTFSVALDHPDFGHSTGQIQNLTKLIKDGALIRKHADSFLMTYFWFFGGEGEGNLSAYLRLFGLERETKNPEKGEAVG